MKQNSVRFLPANRSIAFTDEASVLEIALKNKIELSHSCGGMGSCTTCRVIVQSDPSVLPPRNELEAEIAETRGFSERERLGCQLEPFDGLIVQIPPLKHE
jgi:ferredoxin, 2Fe-2S